MKISRQDLKKALGFLRPAIGKNESRRNLMNIHVQTVGPDCIMTAANAYLIKRVKLEMMSDSNVRPFLIPSDVVPLFVDIEKNECNHHEIVKINPYALRYDDKAIRYKQPDIEYPNLEKLISGLTPEDACIYDDNNTKPCPIGINANFMTIITSGLNPDDVMKMEIAGPEQPIRFTTQDGRYISVLMPVRIAWGDCD